MYELELEIPFETDRHADIVLKSLIQDEEPRSASGKSSIESYGWVDIVGDLFYHSFLKFS